MNYLKANILPLCLCLWQKRLLKSEKQQEDAHSYSPLFRLAPFFLKERVFASKVRTTGRAYLAINEDPTCYKIHNLRDY